MQTLAENQQQQANQIGQFAVQLNRHIPAYEKMGNFVELLHNSLNKRDELFLKEIKGLKEEIKNLKK